QEAVETLCNYFRIRVADARLQAKQECGRFGFGIRQCLRRSDARWFLWVVQEIHEIRKHSGGMITDQTECTGDAEGRGRVFLPAPNRLELDVASTLPKETLFAVFELVQSLGNRDLCPALLIGLFGFFQKAAEGDRQIGYQFG